MITRLTIVSTIALLVAGAVGCADEAEPAPDFPEDVGQDPWAHSIEYPAAPTGFAIGDTIANFKFVGYANFTDPANNGELQIVQMSDFYNPTGTEVFAEDSAYGPAGTPKPKALNLLISSVWCGPCSYEAQYVLPEQYANYKPQGGHFVAIMIDGIDPGTPATLADLSNWATRFNTNYTLVVDPASRVIPLYEAVFPGNLIVRTSDMKIVHRVAGVPRPHFWTVFDETIAGTYSAPGLPPPASD
jgi:hypothetical protein